MGGVRRGERVRGTPSDLEGGERDDIPRDTSEDVRGEGERVFRRASARSDERDEASPRRLYPTV